MATSSSNESLVFEYNAYALKPGAKPILDRLARALGTLLADPNVRDNIDAIVIQGHTDERGAEAFNRDLSARRANAVLGYMFGANPVLPASYGSYIAASAYSCARSAHHPLTRALSRSRWASACSKHRFLRSPASKEPKMNAESRNEDTPPLSIVVGLAFTDADGPAFDKAARIAQRVPRSVLSLVHVFATEPTAEQSREIIDHLRLYVNEKAAAMGGMKAMSVGIHVRAGKTVRELAQFATDVGGDLLVLGSHRGPHLKSWILGSTADQLVTASPCPVLVAAPAPKGIVPHEPVIEPPCPECMKARAVSGGASWWCERHSHHAKRAHTFSYQRELPFASHDSEVIPTGIKFE